MFRLFSPKSEICDVFTKEGDLHVLIRQPRKTGAFDRSNTASGFLVFNDADTEGLIVEESLIDASLPADVLTTLAESDLPLGIYAPKIALLPAEGATNQGLLSYLKQQEGISVELVDTYELNKETWKRMFYSISRNHRTSIYGQLLANDRNRFRVARDALNLIDDELRPVHIYVEGDNSRLEKTLAFLEDRGLARKETLNALAFVVDKFVLEGKGEWTMKKRQLMSDIESRVKLAALPRPT